MDVETIAMECPHCEHTGTLARARYVEGYRGRCPTCDRLMSRAHPASAPTAADEE